MRIELQSDGATALHDPSHIASSSDDEVVAITTSPHESTTRAEPRDAVREELRRLHALLEAGADRRVMELLVEHHGDHVYRYCRRVLGDTNEADDTSQTVFVHAFRSLQALPRVMNVRGWLLGIAHNRCIDRIRSRRHGERFLADNEVYAMTVRCLAASMREEDPRLVKALDECLDRLGARSREVLVWRFHDELSYAEMSELTSDSQGALRVRLVRALAMLRRCLERKGVEP